LLTGGMSAEVMSVNNDNAQWLQSRQFQRQEIASWFLLPANKLNDTSSVSYSSVAAYNQAYLDQTLMNWIVSWEEELTEKLLTTKQRTSDEFSFEFITAGLLRADLLQRYQAYQVGIASEFLSPNEVRRMENMRAREGGDVFQNPNTKPSSPAENSRSQKLDKIDVDIDVEPDAKLKKALDDLLIDRMTRMVKLESSKAIQAAASDKNFVAWLEVFYADFGNKIKEALEPCIATAKAAGFAAGVDAKELSDTHVMESIDMLLVTCGECTQDKLQASIENEVESWHSRIETMVKLILED